MPDGPFALYRIINIFATSNQNLFKMKTSTFLFLLLATSSITASAQSTKPQTPSSTSEIHFDFDYSDWNNWAIYSLEARDGSKWSSGNGRFEHDYAPGYKMDNPVVDDWMVTRKVYEIEPGAKIDSIKIWNVSWMMQVYEGDTIGVYFLQGDRHPNKAQKRILVFDMRGDNYKDRADIIRKNIPLPTVDGPFHIALRYRNTKTPSNWYQIGFDDICFRGMKQTTGIEKIAETKNQLSYTLCNSRLQLTRIIQGSRIRIFSSDGRIVYSAICPATECAIDLSAQTTGIYIVEVSSGKQIIKQKIAIGKPVEK